MKTFLNSRDPVLLWMQPWFWREETELAVGLLLWRTVQMTVLECLDSLAALLTDSDLLPDCDHERCMDMTVCALTQSPGWMDRPLGRDRWRSVGQYSLLSLFSTRRKWWDRSSNASVSLSPEGVRVLVEKGHIDRQRAQRADWPLWGRAIHVMPQCHTEHSDPPLWKLSRRGWQGTLHFHIHLRRKDTPGADGVDNQWKAIWESLMSLAHKEGFIAQTHGTCCGDFLYGSFVKVFMN